MGFGESAKNGSQRCCFFCQVDDAPLLPLLGSISAKLSTNTCLGGGSRYMVSYSRKVSIKGSNFLKNRLLGYPVCAQPTGHGNVLRRLDCFHPLLDIPQIYPSWVTFAEGCTVFQLSTSERLPLPRYQQWPSKLARGPTIGSPICTGTLLQCTFSSLLVDFVFTARYAYC